MKRKPGQIVALLILAATALISTACGTTINKVIADPSRYRTREVRLSGSVTESISLGGRGAYRLEDGTGQLWVVSDQGTPQKGARVSVRGTIVEAFNFGSLGDRINLPGLGSGVVLRETSHKAQD